jgi:Fe2+ transport system protein FeoA
VALSDLEPGDRATVVRLAEHDGELLHWFYDQGFAPGTSVEVSGSDADTMSVLAGGEPRSIADKQASGLFVRRAA